MLTAPHFASLSTIRHGFFTRGGGVSEGVYASLNCGPGSADRPQAVAENRARVCEALGAAPRQLCTLYQVHGKKVITVEKAFEGERPEADAMVTKTPGLVLGILTADCGPILFADPVHKIIGAAHAGWKGARLGIIEETVKAMEALGAKKENIVAAIGPCIAQESYEVGPEFVENFIKEDAGNKQFFHQPTTTRHQPKSYFDLKAYIRHSLEKAGILEINTLANDTCVEEDSFFSYRRKTLRNEPDYGRQISAIMLK